MLIAGITWQLVNLRIANVLEMMYAALGLELHSPMIRNKVDVRFVSDMNPVLLLP
jgi:hypothetical protein